jgi:putative transposase
MPRQARIDSTGALHHIIARGIERRKIFQDDQDCFDFLKRLGQICEKTQTCCYAWALIPNHFHLLLRTGAVPMATVMRRLLTGHAISYNRRHRRAGHLFQNRYKSILCQEDAYFLELVRYIHLNPLRAGLVHDIGQLDRYPFSGHSVIMGKHKQPWQKSVEVLTLFGERKASARQRYSDYVAKGIDQGRRNDLMGGGLIRSTGGWAAVREMRKANIHVKSDERILGDGDFVARILSEAGDCFERRYAFRARGINVNCLAEIVAKLLDMPAEAVWLEGRYKHLVTARSLICFWAVRYLGIDMTSLARCFKISTVAVSKSVKRGAEIVTNEGYDLEKLIS